MQLNFRDYGAALMQTGREFMSDKAMRLSAALAYYSLFSPAPPFLIALAVAGTVLGDEAVRGQLENQLKNSLGASGAFAVQEMVAGAGKPKTNVMMEGRC